MTGFNLLSMPDELVRHIVRETDYDRVREGDPPSTLLSLSRVNHYLATIARPLAWKVSAHSICQGRVAHSACRLPQRVRLVVVPLPAYFFFIEHIIPRYGHLITHLTEIEVSSKLNYAAVKAANPQYFTLDDVEHVEQLTATAVPAGFRLARRQARVPGLLMAHIIKMLPNVDTLGLGVASDARWSVSEARRSISPTLVAATSKGAQMRDLTLHGSFSGPSAEDADLVGLLCHFPNLTRLDLAISLYVRTMDGAQRAARATAGEIGRASCRERV